MIPPPADPHRDIPNFVYQDDGWDEPLDGPYVPWQPDEMENMLLEELEEYDYNDDEYVPGYINNYAGDSSENSENKEEDEDADWQNGCTDPNGVMPDLNPIIEGADTKNTEIDWDKVREEIYLLKEDGIDR